VGIKGKLHNKKGIRANMLPKHLGMRDAFKLARDCGFEQLEPFATFDKALVGKIRDAAKDAGLRIGSVANPMNWKYPLSSGDPLVETKAFEAQTAALQNAHDWGADAILTVPGVVTPSISYEDAWIHSRKQIGRLIPVAEKLGVVIALEEQGGHSKFLLTPIEFAQYIDAFKSAKVRAYFDVGNIVPIGYPQDWIHTLGKRIVKVHLKDYDPKTGKFVGLGEGAVDWPAVRKAFMDIGYTGTFISELPAGDAAYLRDVSQRIDRLLLN
jgi:L-ribulose-5-phosphate 3-epimerase